MSDPKADRSFRRAFFSTVEADALTMEEYHRLRAEDDATEYRPPVTPRGKRV